jgi:Holliday junction resolvase RusA-like endonuclease
MVTATIWIPGTPIPQGSKVARAIGNRAVMFEANKKHKPWRQHCHDVFKREIERQELHLFDEALHVSMTFFMPKPKSVKRLRPSVKPDLSKLVRAVEDSMTTAGLIKDDALICAIDASKHYSLDDTLTGVLVTLRYL